MRAVPVIAGVVAAFSLQLAHAEQADVIAASRSATVRIMSPSAGSSGTGFFIDDDLVLTCFHVIAAVAPRIGSIDYRFYQDLDVVTERGEHYQGKVVSFPSSSDPGPLLKDFALVRVSGKSTQAHGKLALASSTKSVAVGDDVVFSGYPLAVPGMTTHRGMISGMTPDKGVLFVEAPINKGNSGGALLDRDGQALGLICQREGSITSGLDNVRKQIEGEEKNAHVELLGVDPLQATKSLIGVLDTYISPGIGYAFTFGAVRKFAESHPELGIHLKP